MVLKQPLSNLLTLFSLSFRPFQDSDPCIRTDITILLNSLSFVESETLCAFQTLSSILNAAPAFPILMPTSFLTSPSFLISHPRYVNFYTSFRSVSSIITRWLPELRILMISVFLVFIFSPTLFASATTSSVIIFISSMSFANRHTSSA